MRDHHVNRQTVLASRIASGLPAWAVSRGSHIPADDVSAMMLEAGLRDLVDSFVGILPMDREARSRPIERIAAIMDDARTGARTASALGPADNDESPSDTWPSLLERGLRTSIVPAVALAAVEGAIAALRCHSQRPMNSGVP